MIYYRTYRVYLPATSGNLYVLLLLQKNTRTKITSSPGESIVEQLVEEIEHQSQGLDPPADFLLSKRRFVFFAGSESNVIWGFV